MLKCIKQSSLLASAFWKLYFLTKENFYNCRDDKNVDTNIMIIKTEIDKMKLVFLENKLSAATANNEST